MRTRLLCVHLVALVALALLVSAAAAAPGHRKLPTTTAQVTKPVPAWVTTPKTGAMLGGSTYPWLEPVWTRHGGALLPTLPGSAHVANTQPPAGTPTGSAGVVTAPKTAGMLGGSTYPWVEPVWTGRSGALLPTLPRAIHVVNTQPPARIPTG